MAGINWKNNREVPDNFMGRKKLLANKRYADQYSLDFVNECLKRGLIVRPVGPNTCLLYTSPSPRDRYISRMPSSA